MLNRRVHFIDALSFEPGVGPSVQVSKCTRAVVSVVHYPSGDRESADIKVVTSCHLVCHRVLLLHQQIPHDTSIANDDLVSEQTARLNRIGKTEG